MAKKQDFSKVSIVALRDGGVADDAGMAEAEAGEPMPTTVALAKVVREYPLPGALQTHEMALLLDQWTVMVSQQSNSTLLRIKLDPTTLRPASVRRFLVGTFWSGLHGLAASVYYPGTVWATLQYTSQLVRFHVDVSTDTLVTDQVIQLPAPVQGPHCIVESGDNLWVTCKDSSHVVKVKHLDDDEDENRFSVYQTSRRPILIAVHGTSRDVYSSLDVASKIWRLVSSDNDDDNDNALEIDVPASRGNTPVGLVVAPDGNVWFSLLGDASGGTGTFARISASGEFTWFRLAAPLGADAGLIHLAFGDYSPNALTAWLLGSSLLSGANGVDAIFSVVIDPNENRIRVEHSVCFPTQRSASHRVLLVPNSGLFVTELSASLIAHVEGTAVFTPLELMGETTDYHARFGDGVPSSQYRFKETTSIPSVDKSSRRGKKRQAS